MTIPTQTIAFINGQFLIMVARRGFEMGDHLQIKGKTPMKVLI